MTLYIEAIRRIKSLVDTLRCGFCDKLDGVRLRYACGHTACQECLTLSDSCILCLTPPGVPHVDPKVDECLSNRVQHAIDLLNTFQDLFHIDVYKWSRLSDQLKVEKELFPECIQAPIKYCNKKKRSSTSLENSQESIHPGEFIEPLKTPKMSYNFVQQWLDNSKDFKPKPPKRKPFSDLDVNISSNSPIKKRADLILDKVKDASENFNFTCQSKTPKRIHFKQITPLKTYNKHIRSKSKASSKATYKSNFSGNLDTFKFIKNEKEESGIEIDDDPVVIHDTQSEIMDKDKLACLAVLEADNDHDSDSILRLKNSSLLINHEDKPQNKEFYKVPFYKKGKLHESCHYCQLETKEKPVSDTFRPVLITIENDTFKTTIKVTNDQNQPFIEKTSRSVQTNCNDLNIIDATVKDHGIIKKSQDLFNDEISIVNPVLLDPKRSEIKEGKSPVIVDSDSDTHGSSLQVTAEVHRSCEQVDYGILAEVSSPTDRLRKRPRGLTPTSTDSSEKENRDPNRPKKSKKKKKQKY